MRIGIFTEAYKPLISGVVTSIVTLKEGLEELGHEVYIICPWGAKQKVETDPHVIRLRGLALPKKSLKGFRLVPWVSRFTSKIAKYNFDIIHVHTEFSMGSLAMSVKKKLKVPMVYTLHSSYQDFTHHVSKFMGKYYPKTSQNVAFWLNNRMTKKADMTIVPTKKIYDKMFRLKHDGRFTILPSGIDLNPFYKENHDPKEIEALKQKLGLKPGHFVAVLVSRIAKEKSIGDLIDAWIEYHDTDPDAVFLIVGDGPDKEALERYVKKHNAQSYIRFIGFIKHEEVCKYYQLGDIFLNASTTETQGLTYIEALAGSLPIIVRYDDVFDQFVEDRKNGIFFREKEELVQILKEIHANPDILKTLTENARPSVEKYSKEAYAQSAAKLYQQLIDEYKEKSSSKKI
jgi:1,2-diacylglycerol 3-alpha-glucosyltransferase